MRIRTSNGRLLGFLYKPGDAEVSALRANGMSEIQAREGQHYEINSEGVDLPDAVATYALNLYSAQIQAMEDVLALVVEPAIEARATTGMTVPAVDITSESQGASVECPDCDSVIEAKTLPAAKGQLTKHNRLVHSA